MTARQPVSELAAMLAGMAPALDARAWFFEVVDGPPPADAFAVIREDEGITAIVPGERAGTPFARITLTVHSALEGVGLTAAVSAALADGGIACNVVAGYHHDHLFVPWERRDEALVILQRLAGGAG
ncbi:ACT domain-containing protein [Erythrobacter dokdonensis]|uniref:ACT_7 domain-containing protein n=1 Tax=Erythrobacter dokdonensis DSW-74 TaxID=1300349 RepID=A0A1A7BJ77_9SPHN|nr:ACT domain-containing protein [Erythrobacter dokdonensis]MEE4316163.1 ACT domain-containing protein [Erythrobacter sp.]OBV11250.1 ACT_7 domain-containing protein [Erythrobacter dokdonensis DSW-74]